MIDMLALILLHGCSVDKTPFLVALFIRLLVLPVYGAHLSCSAKEFAIATTKYATPHEDRQGLCRFMGCYFY